MKYETDSNWSQYYVNASWVAYPFICAFHLQAIFSSTKQSTNFLIVIFPIIDMGNSPLFLKT